MAMQGRNEEYVPLLQGEFAKREVEELVKLLKVNIFSYIYIHITIMIFSYVIH